MRVLVVGVGSEIFGAAHAPALEAVGAEVVGVHDASAVRGRRVAGAHGWVHVDELDELLAIPADAAVIVSPHPFHAEQTLACLRAGLDVLVEKPVAVSVGEADAVVAEADASGRVVAVAFQHRLRREVQAAKRLIEQGRLGRLHRAEVVSYYPKRSVYYAAAPWRGTWEGAAGGVVLNQGQHDLDLLTYLAGTPSRLCGVARTRLQPTETEDTAEAIVEWADGATGSIHISSAADNGPQRIEFVGTAGVLRLLPGRLEVAENDVDMREFAAADGGPFDRPGARTTQVDGGGGTHEELYRDFVAALHGDRRPVAPVAESLAALELTNALTLSSHDGRWVDLPLDRGAYATLLAELRPSHAVTPTPAGGFI